MTFCNICGARLVNGECPSCARVKELEQLVQKSSSAKLKPEKNIVSVLGFVLSLLAIAPNIPILSRFLWPFAGIATIAMVAGFIFSIIGKKQSKKTGKGNIFATVGLVVSIASMCIYAVDRIISTVLSVISIIFGVLSFAVVRIIISLGYGAIAELVPLLEELINSLM